jgi:hypothetical protein
MTQVDDWRDILVLATAGDTGVLGHVIATGASAERAADLGLGVSGVRAPRRAVPGETVIPDTRRAACEVGADATWTAAAHRPGDAIVASDRDRHTILPETRR